MASAATVDEYSTVERCVEAALLAAATLSGQHTGSTERVNLRGTDAELLSQFVAGEKALIAQTIGPAFQPVEAAHVTYPLRGKRIALPICNA